jgi:hypothetical protein
LYCVDPTTMGKKGENEIDILRRRRRPPPAAAPCLIICIFRYKAPSLGWLWLLAVLIGDGRQEPREWTRGRNKKKKKSRRELIAELVTQSRAAANESRLKNGRSYSVILRQSNNWIVFSRPLRMSQYRISLFGSNFFFSLLVFKGLMAAPYCIPTALLVNYIRILLPLRLLLLLLAGAREMLHTGD